MSDFTAAQIDGSRTPREAIQAGVVDTVLPLSQIAGAITRLAQEAGA
jgi:chemotaxis response regulator CheB